jgi:glycosyltransferase involved in cell wall biosynthesis
LLCLARIDPAFKGQHILLEVLAQEQWRHRDWRLLLVGGGRLSETVHRLVRYYGLDDGRVDMVGHEGDVIPVIASADLIVMPSLSEGTPYAAVEGMAAGRPVVATPVGGFAELVSDGRTGWLAEAATSAHFAEALERAWSMRAEWAEIGDAAADYVAEHCRSKPTHDNLKELLLADVRHRAL